MPGGRTRWAFVSVIVVAAARSAAACSEPGSDASPLGDASAPDERRPDGAVAQADAALVDATPDSSSGEDATDAAPPDAADAADGGDDASVDAGPPAVQLIGRFDERDASGPRCAWPGCRILANFSGTAVSVELTETKLDWMTGGPSEWDVAIDGAWQPKLVTQLGTHTYALATNLPAGAHRVELFRRSEAQNGFTQLRGFDFHGGALLPPPPRSARRIEIVGDSQSAGYGNENTGDPNACDGAAAYQSFRQTYGARIGAALGAEVHGTAYSGKGVVKNFWRPDTSPMPVIYPLANPLDPTSTHDLSSFVPHVVVVMIGGNDLAVGQPDEDGANAPATAAELTNAFRSFVTTLRAAYAQAHVLLVVPPTATDANPPGRMVRTTISGAIQTVVSERAAVNDTKVTSFAPGVAQPAELTGCRAHGNALFHQRLATEIGGEIAAKLGWN